MKILYLDIETAPSLGYVWSSWKTNVISYRGEGRHGYMLCFSYLWHGQKTVRCVAQTDFPEAYAADPMDDSHVVRAALALLDEADIVIGHNTGRRSGSRATASRTLRTSLGWKRRKTRAGSPPGSGV